MDELKTYTVQQVAEILHLSTRTIYTYIETGKIKAIKFGRVYRINDSEIRKILGETVESN